MKIVNIDRDDLESLEQLKGYFNPDPTPDSQVFADLLDYGQHGDLSGWLREHGEEGMASKIDAIPEGLSDSKYYAALKQAVTGEMPALSQKPSFDKCFDYEVKDPDLEVSEAKVKVKLKVLMSVNEEYEITVFSGWGEQSWWVNPYNYAEGETINHEFIIGKQSETKLDKITVRVDGMQLYNEKAWAKGEGLDFEVGGVPFKMIPVKGGTFKMGSTPEMDESCVSGNPTHDVTLSTYYIAETPVTQALWEAVMDERKRTIVKDEIKWDTVMDEDIANEVLTEIKNVRKVIKLFAEKIEEDMETINKSSAEYPRVHVSWDDCQKFINKLNAKTGKHFRLPSEAEWEYAARGGNKSRGYKYSGSNDIDDVAWYDHNSGGEMHPVKAKKPNELGIYDMTGNVLECCQDRWGYYHGDHQTNPTGPNSGMYHVGRGGSWSSDARNCCLSHRFSLTPSFSNNIIGFRLALSE